jgi:5-methylcytosine-specific restriction enzyme B
MNINELIEKAKQFSITEEYIKKGEEDRLRFINKFPLETIKNMTIEQYSVNSKQYPNNYKDTFIYLLEFGKILAGIGGGNASKFYIYMDANGDYCTGSGKNKKILEGEELEREFNTLRDKIYKAIILAKEDEIEEIIELNIPMWNMVLLKILCIYVPEKFFSAVSSGWLVPLGKDLELEDITPVNSENLVALNYYIFKKLREYDTFKDWNYTMLGEFITSLYYKSPIPDTKYWAAGYYYQDEGSKLEEFKSKNVFGIGFFREDLSDYIDDKEALENLLEEKNVESAGRKAIRNFLQIKEGDYVALKSSFTKGPNGKISVMKVSAIGIVKQSPIDGYVFDEDLGHTLPVDWINVNVVEYEGINYMQTLTQIKNKDAINIIFKNINKEEVKKIVKEDIVEEEKFDKNIILYGPPGTGKTYNVVNKALEIIDKNLYKDLINSDDEKDREKTIDEFNKLIETGQIAFSTFHQSYGYEEFIEGLKSDGNGNFVCEDGILKEIAFKASYAGLKKEEKSNINKDLSIDELKKQRKDIVLKNLRNKNSFNFNKADKYVLIIDEINRGNISKVFGELLTLLEEDKRITKNNQVILKLTYTKEEFSLPPNLYIIGTMNTADRSIALMDIALRRRFNFIEMMPDESLLDTIDDIDMEKMLGIINKRIEFLYDRDHMIGHAYLKNVKSVEDISTVFKNKIIPLLQEYFYDDWEKIGLILGGIGKSEEDEYIIYREEIRAENLFKSRDFSYGFNSKTKYHIKPSIGAGELKNIYEG